MSAIVMSHRGGSARRNGGGGVGRHSTFSHHGAWQHGSQQPPPGGGGAPAAARNSTLKMSRSMTRATIMGGNARKSPRQKLFLLFDDPTSGRAAKWLAIFVMLVIVVSCTSFVVETLPQYRRQTEEGETNMAFLLIEVVSIAVFTIEYAVRLGTVSSMPMSYLDPEALHEAALERARAKVDGTYDPAADEGMAARARTLRNTFSLDREDERGPCCCTQVPIGLAKMWKFFKEPFNVIDLVAILPFYVTLAVNNGSLTSSSSFAVIRVLRLARVFRIFKLGKYSHGMRTFGRVMQRSMSALYMMCFFFVLAIVVFGSLIFFFEGGDYDEESGKWLRLNVKGTELEESPFSSIPASFWWVAVTTTTVGYGDMVPSSPNGKMVAVVTMYLGILVLTLPITIIGSNFTEEYETQREEQELIAMVAEMDANDEAPKGGAAAAGRPGGSTTAQVLVATGAGASANSSAIARARMHKQQQALGHAQEPRGKATPPGVMPPVGSLRCSTIPSMSNSDARRRARRANHERLAELVGLMSELMVEAQDVLRDAAEMADSDGEADADETQTGQGGGGGGGGGSVWGALDAESSFSSRTSVSGSIPPPSAPGSPSGVPGGANVELAAFSASSRTSRGQRQTAAARPPVGIRDGSVEEH